MYDITIKVENLEKNLSRIDSKAIEEIIKSIDDILLRSAGAIVVSAKQTVPVRTGFLQSTIGITDIGELSIQIGALAPYAGFVEYGTRKMQARSYLRPAVYEFLPSIQKDIEEIVRRVTQ